MPAAYAGYGDGLAVPSLSGDRANIYLSPGKHHFYRAPVTGGTYDTGPLDYDCADPRDGQGQAFVVDVLKHLPVEVSPLHLVGIDLEETGGSCVNLPHGCENTAVQYLSPGLWVGLTGLSVSLLSTADGSLRWVSRALLMPATHGGRHDEGDGPPELTAVPAGAVGTALCRAAERRLAADACGGLRQRSQLVALDHNGFLVGRGGFFARVRPAASGFAVGDWLDLRGDGAVDHLRHDADGQRVYGDRRHGSVVFDLRGAEISAHSLPVRLDAWLHRRDAGSLSAALDGGRVTLARVAR